ncbi:hypothetical protein DIPPA_04330 [Diplonema papillatum]|nr:hypothetical protein DIPPA_04330 [Diplonema papillatum]
MGGIQFIKRWNEESFHEGDIQHLMQTRAGAEKSRSLLKMQEESEAEGGDSVASDYALRKAWDALRRAGGRTHTATYPTSIPRHNTITEAVLTMATRRL